MPFSLDALRAQTVKLYVVIALRRSSLAAPLFLLVLSRLFNDATNHISEPKHQRILAMIDQFPLLKTPVIKSKLATLTNFRVRPLLLAQSATQTEEHYGTFGSNTGIRGIQRICRASTI
jgi:type IV secretion system protein VirD4